MRHLPKLVLLDRDGVLNVDRPTSVRSVAEFEWIAGSREALRLLSRHQIPVAIVTNQSIVGKGVISKAELDQIHDHMYADVAAAGGRIEALFVCTDAPDAASHRRKPNPGMVEEALAFFGCAPGEACLIGDAPRDLVAAARVGVPRHLVLTGKGEASLQAFGADLKTSCPFMIHQDLEAAVHFLLEENKGRSL